MTTFQAVVRHVPDVHVLWLDAHGDFNTPDTTPSAFLGGMCLAAACGRWDAGFEPSLEPARVLMCGVRDLDAGERVLVETAGVGNARPSEVVPALRAGASTCTSTSTCSTRTSCPRSSPCRTG